MFVNIVMAFRGHCSMSAIVMSSSRTALAWHRGFPRAMCGIRCGLARMKWSPSRHGYSLFSLTAMLRSIGLPSTSLSILTVVMLTMKMQDEGLWSEWERSPGVGYIEEGFSLWTYVGRLTPDVLLMLNEYMQ
jgi:hypothetical protein